VDVAIGLSFVFLTLSVFATSIVEAVAGLLSYRAKSLEDWLAQNLSTKGDAPKAGRRTRLAQSAKSAKDSVAHAVKGTAPIPTPEQKRAKHILGHPVVYAMSRGSVSSRRSSGGVGRRGRSSSRRSTRAMTRRPRPKRC
jgi:hypothetical protein